MVVRRGFRRPPSYHDDRLRNAPVGHFVDVMTNGFGAMLDYRQQVEPRDRWAIAAYIRALQLSEHATIADVPDAERGRERYDIYCSPCHGRTGAGDGMVVRRGFRRPPSYHDDRLRSAPVGHFVDVMTNGFGAMLDYRQQIEPRDRWAIAAYIRALQLSEHATLADVPPSERGRLQ
jgi:mono/diheme cytochrome c family protein